MSAHITLLGPFVDRRDVNAELIDKIAALLANVTSFAFQLTDLAHFPDNLVHLRPHPSARFRESTALLAAAFPDWPPYGGAFTEIVPHLSIGKTVTGNEADDLRRRLPIDTTADQVTLTYWSDEEVEILETFPLSADLPA